MATLHLNRISHQTIVGIASPTHEARTAVMSPVRRILLIATSFEMPYRVLRCFCEAGVNVTVLGAFGRENAKILSRSRFCEKFIETSIDVLTGSDFPNLVNRLIEEQAIDMVTPSDQATVRPIIQNQHLIDCKVFPIPQNVETFDTLNDKLEFARLCNQLAVLHPASEVYEKPQEAVEVVRKSGKSFMVKPLAASGGRGVSKVTPRNANNLNRIEYSPLLLQEFIEGHDECVSAFCSDGKIDALICYRQTLDGINFFETDDLRDLVTPVIEHCSFNGVINFDVRRDAGNSVYLIECNPRFWFNMDFAMLAGANFATLGLGGSPSIRSFREKQVTIPRLRQVVTQRSSIPYFRYMMQDPILTLGMTLREAYRARVKERFSFLSNRGKA